MKKRLGAPAQAGAAAASGRLRARVLEAGRQLPSAAPAAPPATCRMHMQPAGASLGWAGGVRKAARGASRSPRRPGARAPAVSRSAELVRARAPLPPPLRPAPLCHHSPVPFLHNASSHCPPNPPDWRGNDAPRNARPSSAQPPARMHLAPRRAHVEQCHELSAPRSPRPRLAAPHRDPAQQRSQRARSAKVRGATPPPPARAAGPVYRTRSAAEGGGSRTRGS